MPWDFLSETGTFLAGLAAMLGVSWGFKKIVGSGTWIPTFFEIKALGLKRGCNFVGQNSMSGAV
ncbi:hypothetical protein [Tabrizicola sp.]|jgi:hypothetical protein|uniref:hypothetical protein n=1 Tax=Tabrizicola sp. TaxID=2005166 RepID=UPI0035AF141C